MPDGHDAFRRTEALRAELAALGERARLTMEEIARLARRIEKLAALLREGDSTFDGRQNDRG